MSWQPPEHYADVEPLTKGGMGDLLRAVDTRTGRAVVIKRPRADVRWSIDELKSRFAREQAFASSLEHPHIVQVVEIDQQDGEPFLVTEYIDGVDLRQLLDADPMPLEQAALILRQVGEALSHLHERGVLHRDLKPSNVLIGDDGLARLTDFGLAVSLDEIGDMTRSDQVLGSMDYISPEQRHQLPMDERSDQFSLAALAYEMLTGRRASGLFPPPSKLNPRIREEVDAVVMRGLSQDPEDRFPNVAAFTAALQSALAAASLRTKRTSAWIAAIVAAALVLAVAVGTAAWGLRGDTTPAAETAAPETAAAETAAETEGAPVSTTANATETTLLVALQLSRAGRPTVPGPPPELLDFADRTLKPAETAQRQRDWATHLGVPVVMDNGLGMRFCLIPPGRYRMGSSDSEIKQAIAGLGNKQGHAFWEQRFLAEGPQHEVEIGRPFYLSAYEVRVRDYAAFVDEQSYETTVEANGVGGRGQYASKQGTDPSLNWRNNWFEQEPDHPATQLSYADCVAFCTWLGRREELKCRIPTEAEWEYACRAGERRQYGLGRSDDIRDVAWIGYDDGPHQQPVGRKRANPLGLFDMHGNVWERTADWYADDFYRHSPIRDPLSTDAQSKKRVHRGGSIGHPVTEARAAVRLWDNPDRVSPRLGFRVVIELPDDLPE